MSTFQHIQRALASVSYKTTLRLSLASAVLLTLTSYTVGAIQRRGGVIHSLGLDFLTFGHAAAISLCIFWIAVILFVFCWAKFGQFIFAGEHSLNAKIWATTLVPLFFALPIFSRDVYSYLIQGAMVRDGFNPYAQGASINPGPLLYEVSGDWRNTTTPYGPLHLWLGKIITTVTGDNSTAGVFAYKILTLVSFLTIIWAVKRCAFLCGQNPDKALWIGVANPLVMLHLYAGMHNEVTMIALMVLGLFILLNSKNIVLGTLGGTIVVALAVLLKATAAILLPFMVWIVVYRYAGKSPGTWKIVGKRLWVMVLNGAAMLVVTLGTMVLATRTMSQSWDWVTELTGNSKVVNPLSLPSLISGLLSPLSESFTSPTGEAQNGSWSFNSIVDVIRPWSMAIMLLALVIAWFYFRKDTRHALTGASVAYLIICMFNSVTLPWYYAPALVLVGLWILPSSHTLLKWIAILSMIVCFGFDGGGGLRLYDLIWMVIVSAVCIFIAQNTFMTTVKASSTAP